LSSNKGADIPYELLALEVALSWGCRALDIEANEVDSRVVPLLDTLAQKVNKKDLEDTRNLKSKLNRLAARTGKVKQVRGCVRCPNRIFSSKIFGPLGESKPWSSAGELGRKGAFFVTSKSPACGQL